MWSLFLSLAKKSYPAIDDELSQIFTDRAKGAEEALNDIGAVSRHCMLHISENVKTR